MSQREVLDATGVTALLSSPFWLGLVHDGLQILVLVLAAVLGAYRVAIIRLEWRRKSALQVDGDQP